jgi:transmembrane sensor
MNNNYPDINKIIAKILSNESSPEEILMFSEWINKDSKNEKEFRIITDFWNTKPDEGAFSAEFSFEKNKESIFFEENASNTNSTTYLKKYKTLFFSIAASLLILISIGNIMYLLSHNGKDNFIYLAQNEITHLILPDGSEVTLNKYSKLSYSSDFSSKNRIVNLEGEGYFDVKHLEKNDKFIVEVGNSQIEVLGTKFNVNAHQLEKKITTTLVEGSILFKNGNQQILMTPNQQLTLYTQSNLIENKTIAADIDIAWKDRLYRYHSISLAELANELAKNYGVEIFVKEHLRDIKISGSFFQDQTIEEVLRIIGNSISCKWKRESNNIIIY